MQDSFETKVPFYGKVMPQSTELEELVLGACLTDNRCMHTVSALLTVESFYSEKHQMIYKAINELYLKNNSIDMVTVFEKVKSNGNLETTGGLPFIMELANKVASAANVEYHCSIIKDQFIKRKLIMVSTEKINLCFENSLSSDEILNKLDLDTLELKTGNEKGGSRTKEDQVKSWIDRVTSGDRGMTGIPMTGMPALDKVLNGATGGQLIVVAARPSMGKSIFANTIFYNMAVTQKKKGFFWGLEMTSEEMISMFCCKYTGIPYSQFSLGSIDPTDPSIAAAIEFYKEQEIYFEDKTGVNALDIKSKLITKKNTDGLDFAIIDHNGLIKHDLAGRGANKSSSVGETTKMLKRVAKELDIPIILLQQLSRKTEEAPLRIPQMSHLRDSGEIEEDADKIIMLYRPEYYKYESYETDNVSLDSKDLGVAFIRKNRGFKVGEVNMKWDVAKSASFIDYEEPDYGDMPDGMGSLKRMPFEETPF